MGTRMEMLAMPLRLVIIYILHNIFENHGRDYYRELV